MNARHIALVALAAAFLTTSVASAGADATKQRVQIDTKHPGNTFTLKPLQAGAIKRDSGTGGCKGEPVKGEMLRDGQQSWPWGCRALVFTGNRGTLVLRSRYAWVEAGGPYNIATGTWSVVRGTGQYASLAGSGRIAQVGTPKIALARYQGYLTSP